MGWKDILRNNMFLRNMMGDIFGRLEYSKVPSHSTPYFQYRIGSRQKDFYPYFPKGPFLKRYYNEFFNKLSALMGADIYKYIEFHFGAYDKKQDFLHFIQYELSDQLKRKLPSGNIGLNNWNHEEKIIQLFLLLRDVKAPSQIAKTEQLFKRFFLSF